MTIKKALLGLTLSVAAVAPAAASIVAPATKGDLISPFDTATQGTALATKTVSGQSLTFAGDLALAVYKNTLGTLDFYYQFHRTGAGTTASDAVETLTGANFAGYLVDAMYSDADVDGAGIFSASNNPGSPATAQRNLSGGVVGVDFAASNPVAGTELSATYIFRTNATNFSEGTVGVIDGSTFQGVGYQPAAAVPETATWAMFLVGFGAAGTALRGSRRTRARTA